jgi:hypothetical protein
MTTRMSTTGCYGQYEVDLDIQEHGDDLKSREMFGSYGMRPIVFEFLRMGEYGC